MSNGSRPSLRRSVAGRGAAALGLAIAAIWHQRDYSGLVRAHAAAGSPLGLLLAGSTRNPSRRALRLALCGPLQLTDPSGELNAAEEQTEAEGAEDKPRVLSMPCVRNHFATPIYHQPLMSSSLEEEVDELNQQLIAEGVQFCGIDRDGHIWSEKNYRGGYTSFASLKALHRMSSTFRQLEQLVNRHVRVFADYLEFDSDKKLVMTDCWINVMPEGTSHGLHLHPTSTISGTYYVQTPAGCSGLKFEDPRMDKMMAAPNRKAGSRRSNSQSLQYKAKAGELILFESWLRHKVEPNAGDEERISISFNYHWC